MVAWHKIFFQKGKVWQFWPDFAVYVIAATLNTLMKGISAEAYTLSFLLLRAYSAALQRAPRHHCVSTLRDTVQMQLLLGISEIIKGTRQQRKDGRKKNVKEATHASCKEIHAHSSLLKGVSFSMWYVYLFYRANLMELPQNTFMPRKQCGLTLSIVTDLLHLSILPEFKIFLCFLKIVAEITSDLI